MNTPVIQTYVNRLDRKLTGFKGCKKGTDLYIKICCNPLIGAYELQNGDIAVPTFAASAVKKWLEANPI